MKIFVTGGVRSGKSRHAESLLTGPVSYVAPGPTTDEDSDPDWAARIAAHQSRRPSTWTTVETRDLVAGLPTRRTCSRRLPRHLADGGAGLRSLVGRGF